MSTALGFLLGGGLVAIPVLLGAWLWREGFRQGDQPGDVSSAVELVGAGETLRARASITNPQLTAVVAAVKVAALGPRHRALEQGRSTRRRSPDLAQARLLAIDAHGAGELDWPVDVPTGPCLVRIDIYIWQAGGRVRLHRYVCSPQHHDVAPSTRWRTAA
jgi:hypothetical protein